MDGGGRSPIDRLSVDQADAGSTSQDLVAFGRLAGVADFAVFTNFAAFTGRAVLAGLAFLTGLVLVAEAAVFAVFAVFLDDDLVAAAALPA